MNQLANQIGERIPENAKVYLSITKLKHYNPNQFATSYGIFLANDTCIARYSEYLQSVPVSISETCKSILIEQVETNYPKIIESPSYQPARLKNVKSISSSIEPIFNKLV